MLRRSCRRLQRQHVINVFREPGAAIPLSAAVAQHEQSGLDAAKTNWQDFVELQGQLFSYRVLRFMDECRELRANPTAHLTFDGDALALRAKCLFWFALSWWMCRGKAGKLIEPPEELTPPVVVRVANLDAAPAHH